MPLLFAPTLNCSKELLKGADSVIIQEYQQLQCMSTHHNNILLVLTSSFMRVVK